MRHFDALRAIHEHMLTNRFGIGNVRKPKPADDVPTPQADIDAATARYDRRLYIGDYTPNRPRKD